MTKVKLNLASGAVQERKLITAFINNGIKYVIFDGENIGSMGLPIILVGKINLGKVIGISDAEEWKTTKDCLKKIIAGENIEYAYVEPEISADDIYYRQLTLPIASFDLLQSSYVAPSDGENSVAEASFETISPEDIMGMSETPSVEPIVNESLGASIDANNNQEFAIPEMADNATLDPVVNVNSVLEAPDVNDVSSTGAVELSQLENPSNNIDYETLKKEFLAGAEKLFDDLFEKFNH